MNTTKTLLFGGTVIAAGLAHTQTAHADILWQYAQVLDFTSDGIYSDSVENPNDFPWSPIHIDDSGNQFIGNFNENGASIAITEITQDYDSIHMKSWSGFSLDTDTDFIVEGNSESIYAPLVEINGVTYTDGDVVSLSEGVTYELYMYLGSGYIGEGSLSFTAVTVPAPGALALLGLAGVVTRRRRI